MPRAVGPTYIKTVGQSVTGDLTALTNVAQNVNLEPGELHSWSLDNPGAKAYLRIYAVTAANVTMASTAPFQQFQLYANQLNNPPVGFIPQNIGNFGGWSIAATGEAFDGVLATAPTGSITGNVQYKEFKRQGLGG